MKKYILSTAVILGLGIGIMQASTQNLANISDLKETIQILLKYKKIAEDRLYVIEKKLGITNAYQNPDGADIAMDAKALEGDGAAASSEIQKLKDEIVAIQEAIKKIDPNAKFDGSDDDIKARTYVTQKEFEEFKNLVLQEMGQIKETHEKINTILASGAGISGGSGVTNEMWERLKKLEKQMKECKCGLPESEIK